MARSPKPRSKPLESACLVVLIAADRGDVIPLVPVAVVASRKGVVDLAAAGKRVTVHAR